MFKVLMLISYVGMWGYTPPVVETQMVSYEQCEAVQEALKDDEKYTVLCIDGRGNKY